MALMEKIHKGLEKHTARERERSAKKEGKAKGGKHHFRVEQMDDGTFTVHHRVIPHGEHEYSEKAKEETSTHKHMGAVAKHMKECCGDGGTHESGVAVGSQKKVNMKDDEEEED